MWKKIYQLRKGGDTFIDAIQAKLGNERVYPKVCDKVNTGSVLYQLVHCISTSDFLKVNNFKTQLLLQVLGIFTTLF